MNKGDFVLMLSEFDDEMDITFGDDDDITFDDVADVRSNGVDTIEVVLS